MKTIKQKQPLILAVTGHRDVYPDDVPILKAKIGELIDELHATYPDTPLRLLSALAEGADRIAAQVALDQGLELMAPLPMSAAEYEKDFPESIIEFRQLLAEAENSGGVYVLPLAPGNNDQDIRHYGTERDRQYEQVGKYLAQQCHILLALWDGIASEKIGGTAHTIRYKLSEHSFNRATEFDTQQPGIIYHIPTRRGKGVNVKGWMGSDTGGYWLQT